MSIENTYAYTNVVGDHPITFGTPSEPKVRSVLRPHMEMNLQLSHLTH